MTLAPLAVYWIFHKSSVVPKATSKSVGRSMRMVTKSLLNRAPVAGGIDRGPPAIHLDLLGLHLEDRREREAPVTRNRPRRSEPALGLQLTPDLVTDVIVIVATMISSESWNAQFTPWLS